MSGLSDWITLTLLPGLGSLGLKRLLKRYKTPAGILQIPPAELSKIPGLTAKQVAGFSSLDRYRREADSQLGRMNRLGGSVITYGDARYPALLRQIPDPPYVLYCHGNQDLLDGDAVAIVGSRSATSYGRRTTYTFAEQLAANGATVISGLALGIDSEAHAGALAAGGGTVGVLGCGIDIVYPKQNRQLFGIIRERGLLLSEYPLGTPPEGFRFPQRNRIIAGLSRAVLVVEAARKSGSLITAQLALDYNREIFAVPGQIDSYKSEGTHWLLRQGAQLAVSYQDILEQLSFTLATGLAENGDTNENTLSGMDLDAVALLQQLESYPQTRDEVLAKSSFSSSRLSELLLYLELEGRIEMVPGDLVRRLL